MTVSKEITRLEQSNIKLSLKVGKEDVKTEYDRLLSDYTKKAQIPGFRKGKVPKDVLLRKFGDALKGEALGIIADKALGQVFEDEEFPKENKPLPYSSPRLEDEEKLELDLENDLCFSVIYDVLPKINVSKWQGYEVEIPDVAIIDADIDRELETIRERNSIVMDKNDGESAINGDVITVGYCELGEDGSVIPNSERQDFVFTLGSGHNIFKFDEELSGMKKGDTKEFTKTYPEDFEDKDLAGKTKKLRVNLTALKSKKLPDLDDDLAQDVNEKFKTLADLKQNIKDRLDSELDRHLRDRKVNALLEKILEQTPAEIPESMIRLEMDSRWRNLARRFNTDADGLYKLMGGNPEGAEGILNGWRPDVIKALHSRLIVETLMDELKIEASDEEAEKEIENQAKEAGEEIENVKKYYEQDQMMLYLKEDIRERKFFDRLITENMVKPGKKENYVDFIGKNV